MDTMASSPLATPPMQDSIEEQGARLRAFYTHHLNEMIDACAAQLVLPHEQANLFIDVAMFAVFSSVMKIIAVAGGSLTDRREVMKVFRQIMKATEDQVPTMLNHLVDAMKQDPATDGDKA